MIEEKKSQPINYFTAAAIEAIYKISQQNFSKLGEPLPDYRFVDNEKIEHLASLPQTKFFGVEQYATLESKAAIIFYKVNKGHIFPNGNKRMSVILLLVFLAINGREFHAEANELTQKALSVAKLLGSDDFDVHKQDIETWIASRISNIR